MAFGESRISAGVDEQESDFAHACANRTARFPNGIGRVLEEGSGLVLAIQLRPCGQSYRPLSVSCP